MVQSLRHAPRAASLYTREASAQTAYLPKIHNSRKTQEIQESFLSSIILPTGEVQDSNIVKILNKNRSSFIEGKLAAENNMKYVKGEENGGIWFPSGVGIDGDIYNYYCKKTIFDDM